MAEAVSDSQQSVPGSLLAHPEPPVCLCAPCSARSQKGDSSPRPFTKPRMSWRTQITSGCGQKPSTTLPVCSREPHTRYRAQLELLGCDRDRDRPPLLGLAGAAKGSHRGKGTAGSVGAQNSSVSSSVSYLHYGLIFCKVQSLPPPPHGRSKGHSVSLVIVQLPFPAV